ncbi:uncharacterized protein LOC117223061 isoform X2 [Megalopta genalis]|uniref:uncharacterized protein LOC117223061 isoform X2 n=1 Tax=Megalopta genalis TaxID=115081 RepID=UPI003FD21537
MIDLTVKTLDSQNHAFSLEDDQITVRGFKEHIAESVALPADSQRLIYCGRVLQDDKKLIDYDVNGKVIHLVQRAPPQPGQRRNDGAQGQGQSPGVPVWQNPQRTHYRVTRTQMHGNAMYVGAMAVPAEMVEGHVPQLSNSLSRCRLLLAERMLQRANALIERLPDQNAAENTTTTTTTTTTSSSSSSTSAMPETNQPPPLAQQVHVQQIETEHFPFSNNDGRGISGTRLPETIAAAIAVALSAAGASNVTLYRGGSEDNVEAAPANDASEENQPQPDNQPQQSQPSQSEQQRAASQPARPPMMAQLLEQLMDTQRNLRTYVDRYRELMVEDRALPRGGGPGSVEESQRIVNVVSESLHYLSHACHALSDISVDMSQEPPRNLRCRPIIIQQSTILQPGLPIQVETHFSIHGQNSNNNNTNEESSQTASTAVQTETNETNPEGNNQQQEQPQSPFGAVFNLPNDMVVMEVSPESNMDTASGSEQTQPGETNNNNNNAGRLSGPAGAFSWSSTPPDFIRNVIQAVAGHVMQGGIGTSTITTQSLPTGGQQTVSSLDGNTNAGQSTQARSNVGTHPTTSTQTRSTSRQQAHPLNVGMSIGQGLEFDPFLPCNSHHIRRAPSGTSNTVTSMLQRARSNHPSTTETPPQSQTATTLTTTNNDTNTTNTTSTTTTNNTTSTNTTSNTNSTNTTTTTNTTSIPAASSSTSSSSSSSSPSSSSSRASPVMNLVHQILGGAIDETHPDIDEINFRYSYYMPRPNLGSVVDMALNYGQTPYTMLFGSQSPSITEENFLLSLTSLMVQNMTMSDLMSLQHGDWKPICHQRMPLLTFLVRTFPDASTEELQELAVNRLLTQLKPHLQSLSAELDSNDGYNVGIDVCATIECLLQRHLKHIIQLLLAVDVSNITFAQETVNILQTLRRQFHAVLRYFHFNDGVRRLRTIIKRFLTERLQGYEPTLRYWMQELFIPSSTNGIHPPQPGDDILSILRYKMPTTLSDSESESEPETEPMETKAAEERTTLEIPPPEDGEEIPATFPNHEQLPSVNLSDWVPIIAQDSVRQRRQLQIQRLTNGGGVGAFSDAYLGTLPTKRRKLIEQQKPRLLISPTPNHSAISASMERLVRESVTRAGVEEVAGAAVAVAVDPGVRRAFGQAIRDCLNPFRYESPDFPDPLRFPNATKYFADQDSTPKQ